MLCSREIRNDQRGDEVAQAASTYLGEQRRRSTRIEQTSPVIIRGVDLLGQPFEERTAAQNLSFHGCRYQSKHHLPKNTWITLEVPSGESRGDAACVRARVAWIERPQTLRDLFQVGVELEMGNNVWGVTFPPSDWTGQAAGVTTMSLAPERTPRPEEVRESTSTTAAQAEASLEVYLQMAMAHTNRDFAAVKPPLAGREESDALLLREEFLQESQRIIAVARARAEEVAVERTSALRREMENAREASAGEFQEKWLERFERGAADAQEELRSSLRDSVAEQLASFEQQVRGTLESEWAEKLSHSQVDRSRWEAEVGALRAEMKAGSEASDRRSEERLQEKLLEVRRDLESSRAGKAAQNEAPAAATDALRGQWLAEADRARRQWTELLESSLDNAAQRLNDRLGSGALEMLERSEREWARRLAELQKETGLTAEAGRAALEEWKAALATEVGQAKAALGEIEQTAGRFSEYSRQLEAASQDSLHELRERLESTLEQQCLELQRRGAELQGKFSQKTAQLLEETMRGVVGRSEKEIQATVSSGLEQAGKASRELAAREEQAEGILRVHRERLRQVAEQAQGEAAAQLASGLALFQSDLQSVNTRALEEWTASLETNGVRVAEGASAALAKETARQLVETDAQLLVQIEQALESAQERMHKSAHVIAGEFRGELDGIAAGELAGAREKFRAAAGERLESARNEFTQAAEKAAATFGEVIEEAAENGLRDFTSARDNQAREGEMRLAASAEKLLEEVHSRTQSAFQHFEEQLALKAEQALGRADHTLEHQFQRMLERFRALGEAKLEDWSARQDSLSDVALEKHDADLRLASDSRLETVVEQLDARGEEYVAGAVRKTEDAVREACADIFDRLAQAMKKQLEGALDVRHPAPAGESPEHRASA